VLEADVGLLLQLIPVKVIAARMINNLFMISRFFCEKKKVSKGINYKKFERLQ